MLITHVYILGSISIVVFKFGIYVHTYQYDLQTRNKYLKLKTTLKISPTFKDIYI